MKLEPEGRRQATIYIDIDKNFSNIKIKSILGKM